MNETEDINSESSIEYPDGFCQRCGINRDDCMCEVLYGIDRPVNCIYCHHMVSDGFCQRCGINRDDCMCEVLYGIDRPVNCIYCHHMVSECLCSLKDIKRTDSTHNNKSEEKSDIEYDYWDDESDVYCSGRESPDSVS